MVSAEIDWLVTTKSQAVQFSLSGNSPVSMSQIVALGVDNSRSGADVAFIFPDSGFVLTVPAHNQLIAPVFTNALMFYASSPAAIVGDIVSFQIFNSMPPPVPIAPSTAQNHASASPAFRCSQRDDAKSSRRRQRHAQHGLDYGDDFGRGRRRDALLADLVRRDRQDVVANLPQRAAGDSVIDPTFPLSGLNIRFVNGVVAVVSGSTLTGALTINLYYSTP